MLNYGIQVMSVVHFTHTVSRDIFLCCVLPALSAYQKFYTVQKDSWKVILFADL